MCLLTAVVIRYSVKLLEAGDGGKGVGKCSRPTEHSVPADLASLLLLLPADLVLVFTHETLELLDVQLSERLVQLATVVQQVIVADRQFCAVRGEPGHVSPVFPPPATSPLTRIPGSMSRRETICPRSPDLGKEASVPGK